MIGKESDLYQSSHLKAAMIHAGWDDVPLTDLRDPRHPFHAYHMEIALEEAEIAAAEDEVPVGAVVVSLDQGVIGKAHNQREQLHDPTAHAEMLAFTQAAEALKQWRLTRCILYVTLEPCPMCAGAAVQARLPMLVYGAADPKAGACHTLYQITNDARLNHRLDVLAGVEASHCGQLLSRYFQSKRKHQFRKD
jgi:tRNA(adenine34) deaminase